MESIKMKIEEIKPNPENPRFIKDEKYKKLVQSIREFPEMLDIRPIVIDENNIVLGGNMRLKACKESGIKEIPVIRVEELTEDQKREFILKDNQSFGEWDTKMLSTWDQDLLLDSGFEQWDLIDIFGTNPMADGYKKEIEGSNFNPEEVNVEDYIKQNIIFINELMLEFEDDEVKSAIMNLKETKHIEQFTSDLKDLIKKWGSNPL
jgi:hypothetical protein